MSFAVEKISADISEEEFRRKYAIPGKPVIITGGIEHWPARKTWSLDYFEHKFPEKKVNFSGKTWTMREFVQQLRSGASPQPYLNQVKLKEQFQELFRDVGDLKFTRCNALNSPLLLPSMRIGRGISALFIGTAGSGFGKLHWDYSYLHVYISQIRGRKNFVVYAPSDSEFLYPKREYPADSSIPDINHFNVEDYPNLKKATPIRFTAEEGETAFIPAGWWHATQMDELSISIAESALGQSNWKLRYEWYLDSYRSKGVPAAKLKILSAYMKMTGLIAAPRG